MSGFVPPQDLDAEAAVLSTCMLVPEAFDEVATVLAGEHFYADANRRVFEAIEHITQVPAKVDIVTVARRLRDLDRLEQVGGTTYLAQLVNATPATTHVLEHAKIVRDCWRKRTAIQVLQGKLSELKATDEGVTLDQLDAWMSDVCADIEAISTGRGGRETIFHASDLVKELVDAVHDRAKKKSKTPGIPTGIKALDERIGGLKRGAKYEIAARPGIGKTGLLCSFALNVAAQGHGVVLISIEQPKEQITERLVAQKGSLDTRKLERGELAEGEWARFAKAAQTVSRMPLVVDECGTQTAQSIRSAVRRGIKALRDRAPDVKLGLIGIDYVQLVHPSGKKKQQSREQELSEVSSATREMAKEFNCAVVELSQLSRDVEKRPDKRPLLSDMKDSGSLEADAYGVFMLYREDKYRKDSDAKDGSAEILVRKHRGGGEGTVRAMFHAPSAAFLDEPEMSFHDDFDDWRGR